jgi:transmembrane protein DUF3566
MRAVVTTTTEEVTTRRAQLRSAGTPRQARMVVKKVGPWSVLKFSLLFYFCVMLIFLLALAVVYWALGVFGVLDSAANLMETAGFGDPKTGFAFNGYWIFSRLFVIGVVGVVVWSLVNLILAMMYNLVSDVVGGISVTLSEKR